MRINPLNGHISASIPNCYWLRVRYPGFCAETDRTIQRLVGPALVGGAGFYPKMKQREIDFMVLTEGAWRKAVERLRGEMPELEVVTRGPGWMGGGN